MTGKKDDFVPYSPLPSNPNPNQNVVIILPTYHRRHNRRLLNFSGLFFLLLLLGAATFLLYPSDPQIRLARLNLNHIAIKNSPNIVLDVSFSLSVHVKNNNFLSLNYDSLDVSVGYRGRELGSVVSNGGRVRARGSSCVNATLQLDGFQVIHDVFYLLEDLAKGVVPFDAQTKVEGNLGLLFFNVPLKATVSCLVYVNINDQSVMQQDCYPESLGES